MRVIFVVLLALVLVAPVQASNWDKTNAKIDAIKVIADSLYANGIDYKWSVSGVLTGTAAADSLIAFSVGSLADIYVYELSMEVTVAAGATSELANFVIVMGGTAGTIVRLGEGKNLNSLTAGVLQWVSPATAVLSDSLAYGRTSASATNPVVGIVPWKLKLTAGSKIKLLLPGSSTATKIVCNMKWGRAEAATATVTPG